MTTWDPANKNAAVALTNGNLTATVPSGTAADSGVYSTTSYSSGKKYVECRMVTIASNAFWSFGIVDGTYNTALRVGQGTNGIGFSWTSPGWQIVYNNVQASTNISPQVTAGDIIAMAYDFGAGLIWWNDLTQGGGWLPSGDPGLGTGGQTTSGTIATPTFLAWSGAGFVSGDDAITLNPGPGGFTGTIPTGFVAWDATVGIAAPFLRA